MEQVEKQQRGRTAKSFVVAGLAGSLTLAAIAQAASLPSRLGYSYYTEQFLALVLGLSLSIIFLVSGRGEKSEDETGRSSVLDWILSALGLFLGLYIMVAYPSLVSRAMSLPWDALIVGSILFLLVLEGLRRAVGWTLVIVVVVIVDYAMIGHLVPGALQTREVAPHRLAVDIKHDHRQAHAVMA